MSKWSKIVQILFGATVHELANASPRTPRSKVTDRSLLSHSPLAFSASVCLRFARLGRSACKFPPAQLLPVGLAVLLNQTYFRLQQERWGRSFGVLLMVFMMAPRCLFLLIRGGEGYSNVPVQDAQGNTSQCVFEVIFCGQAMVEACVCFGECFQKNPLRSLKNLSLSIQLATKRCVNVSERPLMLNKVAQISLKRKLLEIK